MISKKVWRAPARLWCAPCLSLVHAHCIREILDCLANALGCFVSHPLDFAAGWSHRHAKCCTDYQTGSHAQKKVSMVTTAVHPCATSLPERNGTRKKPCAIILPGKGEISVANFCVFRYNKN